MQAERAKQESASDSMNMKRMRGRNHRGSGGGGTPVRQQSGNVPMNRNHVFDSTGPDLRIRGTSQQLFEKYLQLGRDATGSGDRVMAEHYFQHAEHYFRILNAMNQAAQQSGQGAVQGQGVQQGNAQGPQSNQQRRYESNGDQQDQGGDDEQDVPGSGEQPMAETRPIVINAGAPEGE
jgi:hypothetical protein